MKLRHYKAPLIVVGAGTLGLLLLCGVSAIALQSPQQTFQKEAERSSAIHNEPDDIASAAECTQVKYPEGKMWIPWLKIEVPSFLEGYVCVTHSTRTHGSDFDRQGIISRQENK